MARSKTPPPVQEQPAVVHVIHPRGVYFLPQLRAIMGWRASTARREIRCGRLWVARCAGRYVVLGQWLLEWITRQEKNRGPALSSPPAENQAEPENSA